MSTDYLQIGVHCSTEPQTLQGELPCVTGSAAETHCWLG